MIEEIRSDKKILDGLIQLTVNSTILADTIEEHSKVLAKHDKKLKKIRNMISKAKAKC